MGDVLSPVRTRPMMRAPIVLSQKSFTRDLSVLSMTRRVSSLGDRGCTLGG